MNKCKIDNDQWRHAGKVYFVHSAEQTPPSTGVRLTLEDENGNIFTEVVASHQIEWVEDYT
jgi:hypothetical protein